MRLNPGQAANKAERRIVTSSWPGAPEARNALYLPADPQIRVWLKIVSGGGARNGEEGEFSWAGGEGTADWPGMRTVATPDASGHWFLVGAPTKELPATRP